ncbi:MAG: LysM peptidoglycan-binding domain-containing protein, partial [Clostridia bacterium]|nr:LysM peptidoglycan-binding domain-containing protein [Clostridia bacterium]
ITDSYIPGMEVSVTYNTYKKCELLKNERLSLTLKENITLPSDMPPIDQLYPVRARISDIKAAADNGKLSITGTADILVVYLSSDSSIKSFTHEFTFTEIIDAPSENTDIFVNAKITHADYNFINQTKLDLRCNAEIDIKLCCNTDSFRVIDNIQLGDVIPKKRPSVIIYFVKSGDTLWDIAKKYSITAEKIMAANAMENGDILNAGVRLLIPA